MMPLEITAKLVGPVLTNDGYIALDSLLHWAVWDMLGREPYWDRHATDRRRCAATRRNGDSTKGLTFYQLPLRKVNAPFRGKWYWAASFAQWPEDVHIDTAHFSKRFPQERVHLLKGTPTVPIASGPLKSYRIPFNVFVASEVRFYAVGDAEIVRNLLRRVRGIGKKHHRGFGMVREWNVEQCDDDWSEWLPDGSPSRSIPCKEHEADGLFGFRPPYWHPDCQTWCMMPKVKEIA